jgi:hypothetical protein
MDMPSVEEFTRMFPPNRDYRQPSEKPKRQQDSFVSFGKIDPNYTSGNPSVIFDVDISTGALSKPLMYLHSYTPAANDRVMIIKGVIVGRIQ